MYKKFSLPFMVIFLTGCAGMNSDFEHTTPAKDSGYWLHQADDMTSNSSNLNEGYYRNYYVDVTHYRLLDTGNIRLPLKSINRNAVTVTNEQNSSENIERIHLDFDAGIATRRNECSIRYCYPEPNNPFRRSDDVSRVWIAPYVSPDDNAHLGEVVYFVTKKSQWAGIEEGK